MKERFVSTSSDGMLPYGEGRLSVDHMPMAPAVTHKQELVDDLAASGIQLDKARGMVEQAFSADGPPVDLISGLTDEEIAQGL